MLLTVLTTVYLIAACTLQTDEVKVGNEEPPNIVLILADDLGYGDLSCYGQQILKTPHIDQMASRGMRFLNHYTGSTVCAPSRASLLTGLHTGHVSVRGNYEGQLLKEKFTIATLLKDDGYKTGMIGKWGVGHPPPLDDPMKNGFDHAYGYINMWHAHNFYPEFLYLNGQVDSIPENRLARNPDGTRKWAEAKPEGTGVAEVRGQHTHELFENDALSFIRANQDKKFFLYLALNMPHANNEHPTNGMEVPDYGSFTNNQWPEPEKGFAKMIQMIDQTVGKINQLLEELNLDDKTLLIFASDNGPHQEGFHQMEYFNSNSNLRGMKRDLFDGGIKTPLIVTWPGQIQPNSTTNHLSAFWDILPTLSEVAGVEVPGKIDGISFLPTLTGDSLGQERHQYLYWEFYEQGGRQAVVKDNYKAVKLNVRTGTPDPVVLYDLSEDVSESKDLASDHPDLVKEMEALMMKSHRPIEEISLFEP